METTSAPKTILVVGATGRQGSSLIQSLTLSNTDFRVLALTRKASSPAAQSLISDTVELVEGDLDKPDSIRRIFEDASKSAGLWGVYVSLAFPGLGANAEGEEKHGIMLVDFAVQYKVSSFVYSSAERGGEGDDDNSTLDRAAKVNIERHIRSIPELGWTILRPTIFMENFEGIIGRITATVFREGLKVDTKVQLVAAEDIGHIGCAVFEQPELYAKKIIVVVGDVLTMAEADEAYLRVTGSHMPSVPGFVATAVIALNKNTHHLVSGFEKIYRDRSQMEEGFEQLLSSCKSVYPGMLTFEEWVKKHGSKDAEKKNWNNVSLFSLLTGRL